VDKFVGAAGASFFLHEPKASRMVHMIPTTTNLLVNFFMTLSFEMICKRKNNKIVRRHLSPWEKMLILQPKFPKK
jgi:hypothetical protein